MQNDSIMQLKDIANRIKGMREVMGFSAESMAEKAEVPLEQYLIYENGETDLPFTFIHKCAQTFGIDMAELIEGRAARLSTYNVTRRDQGWDTAKEEGIVIQSLAPKFKDKIAEPYWVRYEYSEELQDKPIHQITHRGQEFDLVLDGTLLVQVGEHKEILHEGDSIYYNSSTPHGMIAVDGKDCIFCSVVIPGEEKEPVVVNTRSTPVSRTKLLCQDFVTAGEDENGVVNRVSFKNVDKFNFGFDVIDRLGREYPDRLAMLHLDRQKQERRFTFEDMKKESGRVANYLEQSGVKKGDRVLLVMRRTYQFWFAMIALHKMGAIPIPASYQLKAHDYEYRFNTAEISAVIAVDDAGIPGLIEEALPKCPSVKHLFLAGGRREGWHDFDGEYKIYSSHYARRPDTPCGEDTALIFFSSGTTGMPKMVEHKHSYPLGHFLTARYWHCCEPGELHLTISDTGWGKACWGKLYGQWLCEDAIFVYDFDRFDAREILPLFAKYHITTFCAPPTMLRMLTKEGLEGYDFSSLRHISTAGEALNPETAREFLRVTGLEITEGFGQTEMTLAIANFNGMPVKPGSMGKASPQYKLDLLDRDGRPVPTGEVGEIVVDVRNGAPVGLCRGYYRDEEKTKEVLRDGFFHTGDTAWRDEDGYFWYVGRVDDVIKSSGYRIGPFEIESVILELPYVLECGVSAVPDEIRGQIVKASIVLTKDAVPSAELVKEIQEHVKQRTAPYKYPRIVVFRDELPKTISGKIKRYEL